MSKVMILGSTGMAGSMLTKYLSDKHEVIEASRSRGFICDLDKEEDLYKLKLHILFTKPDVVINCVGLLIKECQENKDRALNINARFPHLISSICDTVNAKFIHISTDCVFDGKNGPYSEDSLPTETSNYGTSKACGEIKYAPHLTLRTSIIGPDKDPNGSGLLTWVLKQEGIVKGFTEHIWNGITTLELAKQIDRIITEVPDLSGLYHLTCDFPESKFNLLTYIKHCYNLSIVVVPHATATCNKCLINNKKAAYDCRIPPLSIQIEELSKYNLT